MRQIFIFTVLWLTFGSPAFADPASDTLACIDGVALEDVDGLHACMSNFNKICMEAGKDILDKPPQTACMHELEKAVQKLADPIIAAGAEPDASYIEFIRGAALERAFAVATIECDFLMKILSRPNSSEEQNADQLALCRVNKWAIAYWKTIVHDRLY